MSLTSIRHLLNENNLDKLTGGITFIVRIALTLCILLFAAILIIMPFANGGGANNIEAFFFFSAFYSIIWGTIPSMLLLAAIALANRYRMKRTLQPLKTEVKLLVINIVGIFVTVTTIWFISANE
jgi:hypothetical protein